MTSDLAEQMKCARMHVDSHWSDEQTHAVVSALPRLHRRRLVRKRVVLGGATLLVIVGLGVVHETRSPVARVASDVPHDSHPVAPRADDTVIHFADGSFAEPLTLDSRVRLVSMDEARVDVELVHGAARFSVARDPSRRFVVEVGHVSVEVMGARFVVEDRGARVWVAVEKGLARMHGASRDIELRDGQSALYPPEVRSPVGVPRTKKAIQHSTVPKERVNDVREAVAEIREDEVEKLLAVADEARLGHRAADAVPALERMLRAHADDPRAPLAAFTLGRVLLEELDRPREAADAFAEAQRLSKDVVLSSDAMAREVEARSRAGDTVAARHLAEVYVARFPNGARVRAVRRYGGLD